MHSRHHPNVANLKAEARRYRASHSAQGRTLSHARALELVAHQHGFADWNTACAKAKSHPVPKRFPAGAQVEGRYLGHPFVARIVAASQMDDEQVFITLELEEPVDVVDSPRFSALRKRISGTVDRQGRSAALLSSGIPQIEILREA